VPVATTLDGTLLDLCHEGPVVSRNALGGLYWKGLFLRMNLLNDYVMMQLANSMWFIHIEKLSFS